MSQVVGAFKDTLKDKASKLYFVKKEKEYVFFKVIEVSEGCVNNGFHDSTDIKEVNLII